MGDPFGFGYRRTSKARRQLEQKRQAMMESDEVELEFTDFREKYLKEAIERLQKIIALTEEAGPDDILFERIRERRSSGSTERPPKEIALELLRQYFRDMEFYGRSTVGLLLEQVKELKEDAQPIMILWDARSMDFLIGNDLIVYLKELLQKQELAEIKVGILEGQDATSPVDRYTKLVGKENIHRAAHLDMETRKRFQIPFFDKRMKPEAYALDKLFTIKQLEQAGNRVVVVTTDGLLAAITDKRTGGKSAEVVRPDPLSSSETLVRLLEKFDGLNRYLTALDQSRRLITNLIGSDGSFRDKIGLVEVKQHDHVSLLRNRMRNLLKEIDMKREAVTFQSLRVEQMVHLVKRGDSILDEASELVTEHDAIFLAALDLA